MMQGKTLTDLTTEVTRQANSRRDFVSRLSAFDFTPNQTILLQGQGEFGINDIAHDQIAAHAQVPRQHYDRLRQIDPELWACEMTVLTRHNQPQQKRLIRTLDNKARAYLSDRYRCIDNIDLMEQLLPALMDRKDLRFASAEVTERNLYIKVVSDELQGEVKAGDVVRMGLLIKNSEVGLGSVMVAPFSERLICTNGATHTEMGQRKAHLGRSLEGDESFQVFTDETRKADDRAFFLKIRDVISSTLSGNTLKILLEDMRASAAEKIEADPVKLIDHVGYNNGFTDAERGAALKHLIAGADLSRWGLANAVTRLAQDSATYDRASELEALGGSLMSKPLPAVSEVEKVVVRRRARRSAEVSVN
jgi:hypothetical protein